MWFSVFVGAAAVEFFVVCLGVDLSDVTFFL